jgi:hypothetical protein
MSVAPVLKKIGALFGTENMLNLRHREKNSFKILRAGIKGNGKIPYLDSET